MNSYSQRQNHDMGENLIINQTSLSNSEIKLQNNKASQGMAFFSRIFKKKKQQESDDQKSNSSV